MKQLKVLFLDRTSPVSLQVQLTNLIKLKIQQGQLSTRDMLPSSRELATDLQISRNTVVCAYDRLVSEGYLESRERTGIYVSETAPLLRSAAREGRRQANVRPVLPPPNRPPLPFRPCQPDVQLFPLAIWSRLRNRVLRNSNRALLQYNSSSTLGHSALRKNLATYLRASRGVQCEWWQIAITTGSQQALFLLAMLLLKPRDKVYMEDPGYQGAMRAWRAAGAEIYPLAVDENGASVPPLHSAPARIVYVTPSRQFPTGACLSLHRRLNLVNCAAATESWIVEDDYDSEFRYEAPPLPSLQSLDGGNRVIYVGTFSKLLFPSLRLGYAVLPKELVEPFSTLKSVAEDHGPMIEQATLGEFLDSGAFYSHIRRCRRTYAERQHVFLDCISKTDLPLEFRYRDGGMNLTGFLPRGFNDEACSEHLRHAGLDIPSLSSYAFQPCESGLVFGFTAFTPTEIRSSIAKIASAGLMRTRK